MDPDNRQFLHLRGFCGTSTRSRKTTRKEFLGGFVGGEPEEGKEFCDGLRKAPNKTSTIQHPLRKNWKVRLESL